MNGLTSVDALCERTKALIPGKTRMLIGIDGMNQVGKTTLGHELAKKLGAILISIDGYLNRKQNAYTEHIRCHDVRAAIEAVTVPIISEGVCLRAVAARCGLAVHVHIYVRRISEYGIWYDEDICLADGPLDALKKREREIRAAFSSRSDGGSTERETGFREELIDYHAQWKPAKRADFLFDVIV